MLAVPDDRNRKELQAWVEGIKRQFNSELHDKTEFVAMWLLYDFLVKIRPFLGISDRDSRAVAAFLKEYLWCWASVRGMESNALSVHMRERRVNYYKTAPARLKVARDIRRNKV